MDQQSIFLTIAGMALVTYVPRLLPALLLAQRSLHPALTRWLSFIPCAVLAAMLLPALVIHDGHPALEADNIFLWAAVPTFLAAWYTKGLFGPVAVGLLCVAGGRWLLG